jgi:hypothetical protein
MTSNLIIKMNAVVRNSIQLEIIYLKKIHTMKILIAKNIVYIY